MLRQAYTLGIPVFVLLAAGGAVELEWIDGTTAALTVAGFAYMAALEAKWAWKHGGRDA